MPWPEAIDRDANAGRPYREHNGNFTTYRTLSGISYGVGAAALLAGGWLLWTADEGSAQALSEGVLTPALRAGPLSLGFGGTF